MTRNRAKFEPSRSFRSNVMVDTYRRTDQSYKPKGWAKMNLSPIAQQEGKTKQTKRIQLRLGEWELNFLWLTF
jgi:hypothetical protein